MINARNMHTVMITDSLSVTNSIFMMTFLPHSSPELSKLRHTP